MDLRSGLRTIIAALIGIGIIVLLFVLIVKGFSGNSGPTGPSIDLGKYENTAATATLLIDDPTNVDQDHRQVRISVSGTQNEIDIINGYQGTVADSKTYSSNPAAFGAFLQSLKLLNFAKGDTTSKVDYRGFCPTGERYIYTFNDGNKDLFNFWSTSCGQGTFSGNRPGVRSLFENQIPGNDFDDLTGNISLGN